MFAVPFLFLVAILSSSYGTEVSELQVPASSGTQPVRIGSILFTPKLLTMVQPKLPDVAKQIAVTGPVILEIKNDRLGSAADVRIARWDPALNSAAEDAVKK